MNYCIIINDFKSGGAQKATVDLINALLAKKIKLTVIALQDEINFDLPKKIHLEILQKKERKRGILGKYILASRLKKLWEKLNNDRRFDLTISRLQFTNEIVYISKIPRLSGIQTLKTMYCIYKFFDFSSNFLLFFRTMLIKRKLRN